VFAIGFSVCYAVLAPFFLFLTYQLYNVSTNFDFYVKYPFKRVFQLPLQVPFVRNGLLGLLRRWLQLVLELLTLHVILT